MRKKKTGNFPKERKPRQMPPALEAAEIMPLLKDVKPLGTKL